MVAGDVKEEDEESGNKAAGGKAGFDASEIPRTKHEVAPTQISEEDLVVVIPPESALEPAGSVEGIVEGFLVISADISRPTLDIDSILCFQDRTPLGKVDVLPSYCLCRLDADDRLCLAVRPDDRCSRSLVQ